MSLYVLQLVASRPDFVPAQTARAGIVARAREAFPDAHEIAVVVEERVCFVDCGANLEAVRCPFCGARLDEGESPFWQEAMDAAFDGVGFDDLACTTPCCGEETSLDALDYEHEVAFARSWLRVEAPRRQLDDGTRKELEALFGCRLLVVHARY